MRRHPELLIPASSLEVLKTAVIFGADAVYIGGEAFGLRAKAKNFSMEEMKEIWLGEFMGEEPTKELEPKFSGICDLTALEKIPARPARGFKLEESKKTAGQG